MSWLVALHILTFNQGSRIPAALTSNINQLPPAPLFKLILPERALYHTGQLGSAKARRLPGRNAAYDSRPAVTSEIALLRYL
jgi:hypothetical protein